MPDTTERKMGLLGATAIGIGGMVGGGIFAVLGTAVGLAHGATPVAFLLAGIVALLTAYAYARLSASFPAAGGTVVFIHEAFGHHLSTGAVNLLLWVNYLVTIALYASAFGSYAQTFLPGGGSPTSHHVFISLGTRRALLGRRRDGRIDRGRGDSSARPGTGEPSQRGPRTAGAQLTACVRFRLCLRTS